MRGKDKYSQIFNLLCAILLLWIPFNRSNVGFTSTRLARMAAKGDVPDQILSLPGSCDKQIYYGVRHCSDGSGVQYLLVDPQDAHVRFQTVLSSRGGVECNSVNHSGKDPGSNCAAPYPFEKLDSMLSRYISLGAVAIINTDYFGTDGDHGAQGLAVRNGDRLDGFEHHVDKESDHSTTHPSLAISPTNELIIATPVSQKEIDANLAVKYYNTVAGAPLIISAGQVVNPNCTYPYPGDTCSKEAQSAAGITADGQLILVAARLNAPDLARYLVDNLRVQTALKFDGGGSARLTWLDSNGDIQSWGATEENRAVAEGLLVFSSKVENPPQPDENGDPFNIWDKLKRSWAELLTGFTQKVDAWWQELQLKLKDQLDDWWQEQQGKIEQWAEQQLTDWMNQCPGSVALVPVTLGIVLITHNKKKNR